MCFIFVGYFETSPTICDVCDGKDDNIVLTGCFVFVGYFETVPTICDVCDGTDYNIVLTGRGKIYLQDMVMKRKFLK